MLTKTKNMVGRAFVKLGNRFLRETHRSSSRAWVHLSLDLETQVLWSKISQYTMTSIERVDALRHAVEHIEATSVPGDIVECGVWRGGSMMAVALTLLRVNGLRRLWLYDTFSGMTSPGVEDRDFQGRAASDWMATEDPETSHIWAKSSLAEVREVIAETGYPMGQVEFVVGPVETTIPLRVPEQIAFFSTGYGLV
jgi:O-methyltransferase